MPPEVKLQPDVDTILAHLEHITARWDELDEPCVLEIRPIRNGTAHYGRFTVKELREAAEWAADFNRRQWNVYVVVNPISATANISKGAKDEHIVASFFHWADGDDPEAADRIKMFVGPKPTFVVATGSVPHLRPHVYWQLEHPTRNLPAWRGTQGAIAGTLQTDAAVINPSRVMRLAGSVNWPTQKKQAKGYVPELTSMMIYDREPVASEQMARAFALPEKPEPGIKFENLGEYEGKSADDYTDMLNRMTRDGEKHGGVRDTAASLAGMGMSKVFTEAFIRRECPVWDDNVQKLIDSAYEKFYNAPQEPQKTFDHAAQPEGGASWTLQQAREFTEGFVAPEYLIDGVIQRGRLYTLTAPTGSGKTAVMLYVGIAMSRGDLVCERETEPGDVIYMAGENPDDVRARVIATLDAQGISPDECRLHFIPGTFSIRQDMKLLHEAIEQLPNVVLVVVDTLAAYFDGDDSNSNAQMLDFARVLRAMTTAKNKPAVIAPAHPIKNAAKTNLTPMGGSALLNEVDGNLCIWKRAEAVELHWQGKHRGADFEPLMFELKGIESEKVRDSKGRIMPTVMAQPLMETRALEIATQATTMEDRLLLNIKQYDGMSIRQRCVEIGMVNKDGEAKKSSLIKLLEKLQDEKLVNRIRSNWWLSERGEKAIEIIENGGSIVDPDA